MQPLDKNEIEFNHNELLQLAKKAGIISGQRILSFIHDMKVDFKDPDTNPVTSADKAAEAIIKSILQKARPNDGLVGEEGSCKESKTGLRWVFDPLDGTVNYMYQIPHWAFCISCEEYDGSSWNAIIALVYDVLRDEIFSAVKNHGSFLNNERIQVNNVKDLSKALIATEFSYKREKRIYQTEILSKLLPEVRDVRSYGSSALDLCWVACGRWDGFYENELSLWDWSAGSLIVQEAGGSITPLGTGVVASPPLIHEKFYQFVK